MYKFHITGYTACSDPYYYISDSPVDITVIADTLREAVEKAEKILECQIHGRTMKYQATEVSDDADKSALKVKQKVRRFPNFVNTSDIESDMIWNIECGWRVHTCLERCAEVIVVYEKSEVDEAENALKEGVDNAE